MLLRHGNIPVNFGQKEEWKGESGIEIYLHLVLSLLLLIPRIRRDSSFVLIGAVINKSYMVRTGDVRDLCLGLDKYCS